MPRNPNNPKPPEDRTFRVEDPPEAFFDNSRNGLKHQIRMPKIDPGVPFNVFSQKNFESFVEAETPKDERQEFGDYMTLTERNQLHRILTERKRRRCEALKLFRPMKSQAEFLKSTAPERLARGGNRGGKTVICAVDVAQAVTGQDEHGKYPKKNGRFIIVGWDLQHCADVCWRKLYKPGAFKVIKDPVTKELRAYDPSLAYDREHEYLAQDAPPLIPKRFIKHISWEDKRKGVPKTVTFTTGWELTFYSSKGDPPQGIDIDGAWFDEEIQQEIWYKEISARLLDRRKKLKGGGTYYPKFIWSATPLAGTEQLLELHQRAMDEVNESDPTVQEFFLGLLDNEHISADAKKDFIKKLNNEDEYRVRVLGDFAIAGTRVYSEFTPRGVHGIEDFPIPADWTRYCAIDPGRQVCAVLFAAVPPPSCGTHDPSRVYVYDELYLRRCDAQIFATAMKETLKSQQIQEWWIDHHAGRMTEIGSGKTPEEQYSDALKSRGVGCVKTKHQFSWGSDDLAAGILSVRSVLHINPETSFSRFVFFKSRLKHLLWEMERYSYKRNSQGLVTDDVVKLNDHLCDCLRYLAQANLKYVKPKFGKSNQGYTNKYLAQKKAKSRQESGWGGAIKLG